MIRIMNKKNAILSIAFLLLASLIISSCKKDKNEPDGGSASFDQKAMLTNYADNLIIPSYQAVSVSLEEFKTAVNTFEQSTTTQNLEALQQKWELVHTNWMWANAYNFGPAGEQGITKRLVEEVATWPIDTLAVNTKVISLDTAFADFKRDARGLLAIEYLLFDAQKTNAQIVSTFNSNTNRTAYLIALTNKVQAQIVNVLNQWNNGYRDAFIANTGTAVGSSISMMYNEFVRDYEAVKNFKLGIPLGKKAGQTGTEANKVEALFSGKSLTFMQENIKAVENNWQGKSRAGSDALGWKDYLESVTGGDALVSETQNQQANIAQAMSAFNQSTSLYNQINTSPTPLDKLYTEMQKQTRFYKSDMSSLLGIAITFTDADGD